MGGNLEARSPGVVLDLKPGVEDVVQGKAQVVVGKGLRRIVVAGSDVLVPEVDARDEAVANGPEVELVVELRPVLEVQVPRHPLVVSVGLKLVRMLQAVVRKVDEAHVG